MTPSTDTADTTPLSERELEILQLVAEGASNKEIAARLYISPNTVKVHLRNIYAKLEVSSRTEASMWAVREGLISVVPSEHHAPRTPSSSPSAGPEDAPAEASPPPGTSQASRRLWGWIVLIGGVVLGALALFLSQKMKAPTTPAAVHNPTPAPSRWVRRADMPTARADPAVVAYQGLLYVIGGRTASGVTGALEQYDPSTDTWETLPDKPTPVSHAQAAALGGRIYVPGGQDADGNPTMQVEMYNLTQKRWESAPPLPQPLSDYALVAFEGRLYLFGGRTGQQSSDRVLRYTPGDQAWQEIGRLAQPLAPADAVVADQSIFLSGVEPSGQVVFGVYPLFAPSSTPWTGEPLLQASHFQLVNTSNLLFGFADGKAYPEASVLEYILGNNQWIETTISSPLDQWSPSRVTGMTSKIYLAGGWDPEQRQSIPVLFEYQAVYTVVIPLVK